MSDKRPLRKEGNTKDNLTEIMSVSFRPSGLPPKEPQPGKEGSPSEPVVTKAAQRSLVDESEKDTASGKKTSGFSKGQPEDHVVTDMIQRSGQMNGFAQTEASHNNSILALE